MLNPEKMKTMKALRLLSIAALALVMGACAKEVNQPEQTQTVLRKIPFSATLEGSGPETRTTYSEDGDKINVVWKVNDEIALVYNGRKDVATVISVDPGTGKARIEGTLTGSPSDNDPVKLVYPANLVSLPSGSGTSYEANAEILNKVYTQDGTLDYIQNNLDLREGLGNLSLADEKASLKASVTLDSQMAIWKFFLRDNSDSSPFNASYLRVSVASIPVAKATASSAINAYYMAFRPSSMGKGDLSLLAVTDSGSYTFTKAGGVALTAGQYYQSSVSMSRTLVTDLSTIKTNYTAQDGETLTGTLNVASYPVKISIADGATVTLAGITINGINGNTDYQNPHLYPWAGLTCLGNATLILKDGTINTVRGFDEWYPGIYVPGQWLNAKTLTIQGTGTLYASSNRFGSGIGAASEKNFDYSAGNIVIKGGTIVALGGYSANGIGAAGHCTCGVIRIEKTVTSIKAIRGDNAETSIGKVDNESYSSEVYFGDKRVYNIATNWVPNPMVSGSYGGLNLVISKTTYDNDTWTLTPAPVEGKFSVNAYGGQVIFSQGNLQYQATTKTWRFAENQWDFIGDGNNYKAYDYAGWIDMYCWGCNGIDTGGSYYTATIYGGSDGQYNPYGSHTAHLYDGEGALKGKADWGAVTISNGGEYTWRTLKDYINPGTDNEWQYILNTRATGLIVNDTPNARYTMATINQSALNDGTGVKGIILFPDNYTGPTANLINELTWGTINGASNYGTVCTTTGWLKLQNAGCVFLPAGGKSESLSTAVEYAGTQGRYWSSSSGVMYKAYSLSFTGSIVNTQDCVNRYYAASVRLVRDI